MMSRQTGTYDQTKKMLNLIREFNSNDDVQMSDSTEIKVVGSDDLSVKDKVSSIFNDMGEMFMNGTNNMVVSVENGYMVITFDLILSGNNTRVMVNTTDGSPVLQFVDNSTLNLDQNTYGELTALVRMFNPKVMSELNSVI